MNKLLIVTAPSGSGKTTIVRHLLDCFPTLAFSVSATTRPARPGEVNGRDYYFLEEEEFRTLVQEEAFLEWEEVYQGRFYGTLKKEIDRLWAEGKDVVFDIDTRGAYNLKQAFPDRSLALFISPPSLEILSQRLRARKTEKEAELLSRMEKAREEMEAASLFDRVIINDELAVALKEAEQLVGKFLLDNHN